MAHYSYYTTSVLINCGKDLESFLLRLTTCTAHGGQRWRICGRWEFPATGFCTNSPWFKFWKNWPWVKFWKPPDFNQDQFGHFKHNLSWVKVWNHLWNPWPLSAPSSHSYSNILIDIACAVPIALLLSHSYSHSHSSFQVHFLIQYFLLVFPNF